MTLLTGKVRGRKDKKLLGLGQVQVMTDGDMTFDHVVTDWEVCETFIFTSIGFPKTYVTAQCTVNAQGFRLETL